MGLIRSLIRGIIDEVKPKAPREPAADNLEAGGEATYNPAYSPEKGDPVKPEAYNPAYSPEGQGKGQAYAPEAQAQGNGGRVRGGREKEAKPQKFKLAYQVMTNVDKRRQRSLYLTHAFAYSLVIVGSIFLGLSASGNYPTTVDNMKYLGIYAQTIAKYSLYVFSGIVGVIAVLLTRKPLATGGSLALPMAVLLITISAVLATIGMSIYLLTVDLGMEWWGWLLAILMLIQRILYGIAASLALKTLHEATNSEEIRGQVAHAAS